MAMMCSMTCYAILKLLAAFDGLHGLPGCCECVQMRSDPVAVRLTLIFWTVNVGMSLTTGYAGTSFLSKLEAPHIDMGRACLAAEPGY